MIYLIALIPAIGWGIMPLITTKVGGTQYSQMWGLGAGATIIGIIAFLIAHPSVSTTGFWLSVLCGALWTIGQIGQFISFKRIGVSSTMPISTALQLVGNSIIGILIFSEWRGARALTIGIIALIIAIIGALMTSVSDDKGGHVTSRDFLFLLVTSIGYWIYSAFPKIPALAHDDSIGIFLPEMLGILLGATLYVLFSGHANTFKQRETYMNIFAGLSWGCAALAYIFAGRGLGVTTAFVFTQLNVVIATLGGVFILHEQKSKRELTYTIWGIVLLVIGSIMTAFA